MSVTEYIEKNIRDHLSSCGYGNFTCDFCASQSAKYYHETLSNSKDPYKELCDYAGSIAQQREPSVKYKSPKGKTRPRSKRPQEAFNFGGLL